MSRSIHSTGRELREARLRHYTDDKVKAAEVKAIEDDLVLKRQIKENIATLRSMQKAELSDGPFEPVPIRILDEGPYILHPATAADIEAVQRRLPPGVLDGVSEIVLSLGKHAQEEGEDAHIWDPDPVTGRIGLEILPGFYKGWIWGTYKPEACRITLHAYVLDQANPCPMPIAVFFKLQVLSTFVHEVAHHFDHTRRIGRGRWIAAEQEKVEYYANDREHEWTQACVVPYLQDAYPQEVADLLQWLEIHGEVRFDLGELAADPRGVHVSTVERAVEELVRDVLQKTDRVEKLFNFAVNLKVADLYERAQDAIDRILLGTPNHEGALQLRANIWNFQKKHNEAALLASQILLRNPKNWRARTTLTRAYEGLAEWVKVVEITTESLSMFEEERDRLDAIASRCLAYWKLEKRMESDEDLRLLQNCRGASWKVERILRERESAVA